MSSASSAPVTVTLTRAGLRCTRQRRAIYQALIDSHEHPTADALHHLVQGHDDGISLATVYNTLEAFCRVGLAQKLAGGTSCGSARYDATGTPHLHLRCKHTGELTDVPETLSVELFNALPEKTLRRLEKKLGFSIDQVQIELVGQFQHDTTH